LVGDGGSNGVGSSDVIINEDTCRVIGVVIGCGSVTIIIFDIGMNVVIVVAVEGLVGSIICCRCCRLVTVFSGCNDVMDNNICIVVISFVIIVVGCCTVNCGVGAVLHDPCQNKKRREERIPTCGTIFDLAAYCSKIDRLPSIMVVAAGFSCMYWLCYAVLYVAICTVDVVN